MAATGTGPIPARVRWDRHRDHPTSVEWNNDRLPIERLHAVRDERHAYRVDRGPRLTLLVETRRGHVNLVWDARQRRWFLDARDPAA
jgi:hypothetical protein